MAARRAGCRFQAVLINRVDETSARLAELLGLLIRSLGYPDVGWAHPLGASWWEQPTGPGRTRPLKASVTLKFF